MKNRIERLAWLWLLGIMTGILFMALATLLGGLQKGKTAQEAASSRHSSYRP